MFTFSKLLSIIFNHSKYENWAVPKKVAVGITKTLYEDALGNIADTSFNKLYSGANQGRTLYYFIKDDEIRGDVASYLFTVEKRLKNENYRESKFELHDTIEEIYQLLKTSANFPKDIYSGLKHSFEQHYQTRPYLFLAECLYYALANAKDNQVSYHSLEFQKEQAVSNFLFEDLVTNTSDPNPRTVQTLNLLSQEDITLFQKIAPLTFYDNSFDELSGEYVEDHQLISHEDFFELYETFEVKAVEISKLLEAGLLLGGGRHEILVEQGELAGFQTDERVLVFTTKAEDYVFNYHAFHLTQTAKTLLELLEIGYNPEFLVKLGRHFRKELSETPVQVGLYDVAAIDEIESLEELKEAKNWLEE